MRLTKSTPHSTDLVGILTDLGVDIKRVYNDEINGRCPVHHKLKGRESSRYSWYLNSDTGLWTCFSCGARGNLSMLLSELTNDPATLWSAQSHLINAGIQRLTGNVEEVVETHQTVDWQQYTRFDRYPDRLSKLRSLDTDVAARYGIRWDADKKATVIPIISPIGQLWGWQLKKHDWVRNYPEGVHKGDTLFGIERAHNPTGLLLESPLDVVRFHSVYGGDQFSAVASFGANVSSRQVQILCDRFDSLVIAMDNDAAGKLETRRISKSLPSLRRGVRYWVYDDDSKDLGDMRDDVIIRGLTNVSAVYV